MANPTAADLARVPLFEGLSDEDRQRLAIWFDVEDFPTGLRPVTDHVGGYALYVLAAGRARVEHDGKLLGTLEPGDVFGEMAFFTQDGRRTADVVPETDIVVYSLFGTRFRELQAALPDVAARIEQLAEERAAQYQ